MPKMGLVTRLPHFTLLHAKNKLLMAHTHLSDQCLIGFFIAICKACADPHSFVRGGQPFFFFLGGGGDEGRKDPDSTISGP